MSAKFIPIISLGWWQETETPRWILAITGAAALILTLVGTHLFEERLRVNDQRAQQIQRMIDSMVDFQMFAGAFTTEMFADKAVSTDTRSKLIENLNQQYARARSLEPLLDATAKRELEDYKQSLLAMNAVAQQATDVMALKDFYSAAAKLTVAKNRLNPKLQAQL
ncbi:hypothetical protein FJV83_31500 [Mesorhizobium sp. WSM4307]|uniref:hypothetical protein n=1 Tax=unclassified Mesorhizobium TaxID=325217 RepID=UPI00115F7212|nr:MULTISPECIES: hypothetical protein [unclassified Mesorhizobium]TRC72050.1 hypothetical protein FJV81_30460 [Mesorhizobium sp. WSM4315]TRC77826.1 hypothetical protein FJV83_31500 [Mesorhizobium sp. WSM4307]